jgi:hypothetical protein
VGEPRDGTKQQHQSARGREARGGSPALAPAKRRLCLFVYPHPGCGATFLAPALRSSVTPLYSVATRSSGGELRGAPLCPR